MDSCHGNGFPKFSRELWELVSEFSSVSFYRKRLEMKYQPNTIVSRKD